MTSSNSRRFLEVLYWAVCFSLLGLRLYIDWQEVSLLQVIVFSILLLGILQWPYAFIFNKTLLARGIIECRDEKYGERGMLAVLGSVVAILMLVLGADTLMNP
ncbi:hypothetical protein G8764_16805 [Pseudomaricurvus alcaniphilus]|uniref:hypothetical protein n=1 Tax=Pseudomaricurvus alcaniphilus TaxID=1166482 RepID=UPI00140DF1E6|nr:hypothetical protein [Pseudomaricurvus alcaniphilus]NHN38971.1 hypothetical protein [Pseudomaricurvus alcaniphilus]